MRQTSSPAKSPWIERFKNAPWLTRFVPLRRNYQQPQTYVEPVPDLPGVKGSLLSEEDRNEQKKVFFAGAIKFLVTKHPWLGGLGPESVFACLYEESEAHDEWETIEENTVKKLAGVLVDALVAGLKDDFDPQVVSGIEDVEIIGEVMKAIMPDAIIKNKGLPEGDPGARLKEQIMIQSARKYGLKILPQLAAAAGVPPETAQAVFNGLNFTAQELENNRVQHYVNLAIQQSGRGP